MTVSKSSISPGEYFKNLPELNTSRLLLRKLMTKDVNDIYEYASNPEVSRSVVWDYHKSVKDSMEFLVKTLQQYNTGRPASWGIVYKENNKLIGTGGYHVWYPDHAYAEIGYVISQRFWNKGLMTEALAEMMKFGFESLLLNRIEARCFTDNTASERVMQKCGMKYEGTLRSAIFVKGEYRDLKVYSMLRSEFGNGSL
jgi:ribosomal-protein-alanine N-acetyltransferase